MRHPQDIAGAADQEGYWQRYAASRLGISADQMTWFWWSFTMHGETGLSNVFTGTATRNYTPSQLYRLDTGATAGSIAQCDASTVVGGLRLKSVVGAAGTKICMGARFKIGTAVAASDQIGIGLYSAVAGAELFVGGVGATSTTNFVLNPGSGGALDSGVALDTNLHTHLVTRVDGANTEYRIDNTVVAAGNRRPANDCAMTALAYNNGDANVRQLESAWMFCASTAP